MRGDLLTPRLPRAAYARGAFPMGDPDSGEVEFYVPPVRALFPLSGIRVSRSLRKTIRRRKFDIRFDSAFEDVMRACLRPEGNWITEDLIRVYSQAHREGWAHSAEAWREGALVGGVYGLSFGSCFCAESMFHRETDSGKVALWALVELCRERGFTIFDAQIMNPHLASLGAFEVSHAEYMRLLEDALSRPDAWNSAKGGDVRP